MDRMIRNHLLYPSELMDLNIDLTVCAFNSSLVVYQLATLSTELDISLLRQIFIHLTSLSDEKVLKFYRLYWKNMSQETSLTNMRHSF